MAKFTKSNQAILPDGTVDFRAHQSMAVDPNDENTYMRIRNAAPALLDHDYIIKKQAFTIIDDGNDDGTPGGTTYNLYVKKGGDNTADGLSWATAWEHPQQSVTYLANKLAAAGITIQVNIGPGEWNDFEEYGVTSPILSVENLDFGSVIFTGASAVTLEVLSVELVNEDTSGACTWVDLEITVDDPPTLPELPDGWIAEMGLDNFLYFDRGSGWSGGKNLWALGGLAKITALDDINNKITVRFHVFQGDIWHEQVLHSSSSFREIDPANTIPQNDGVSLLAGGTVSILRTTFSTGTLGQNIGESSPISVRTSNINAIYNIGCWARNQYNVLGTYGIRSVNSDITMAYCTSFKLERGFNSAQGGRGVFINCHSQGGLMGFSSSNGGFQLPSECTAVGCGSGYNSNVGSVTYCNGTYVSGCDSGWVANQGSQFVLSTLGDHQIYSNRYGIYVSYNSYGAFSNTVLFKLNVYCLQFTPNLIRIATGGYIKGTAPLIGNNDNILNITLATNTQE